MSIAAELFGVPITGPFTSASTISGVSVSWGAKAGAPIETGTAFGLTTDVISFFGGDVVKWGSAYPQRDTLTTRNNTQSTGARTGIGGRIAFETDGSAFDLRMYGSALGKFTLLVDGKMVLDSPVATYDDGGVRYLHVDLSGANLSPGFHTIEFEFYGGANYMRLVAEQGATVRPLSDIGPRIVILGDSFTEGGSANNPAADFASIVARNLGTPDLWQSGLGGTGWDKANGTRPALVDRIVQDGIDPDADIYVIAMGVNDSPGISDEVIESLQALTSARPDAVVFVVGVWDRSAPNARANAVVNAEIKNAVAQFPGVVFLDPAGVRYTKTDTVHPDGPGHFTLGQWLTDQIKAYMGADGSVYRGVAGDVIGPVYLEPGWTSIEIWENGAPSTRFTLGEPNGRFQELKLASGVALNDLGSASLDLRIVDGDGGVTFQQIDFQVIDREVITGDDFYNTLTGNDLGNIIYGLGGNDVIYGNGGPDELHGGDGNDRLYGGDGNDVLYGGPGADALFGGAGDDIYYIETTNDGVYETATSSKSDMVDLGGYDTVYSSMTYSLAGNMAGGRFVEALILTGTAAINARGNELDNALTGNANVNSIWGGDGNDVIDGGRGNDFLYGEGGIDTALFAKTRSEYTLTFAGGIVLNVRDTATGELDRLYTMEILSFADGNYAIDYTTSSITPI